MVSGLPVGKMAVPGASRLCFAFILSMAVATLHANNAHAQLPPLPALGAYGQLSTWCGRNPIPMNVTALPSIGCFELSPGHSAAGTFAGHQVDVSVDDKGREMFRADGTVVTEFYDHKKRPASFTNLPYVHTMGVAGYSICPDAGGLSCASNITVFSNNPDKTVLFFVSRCFPPDYRFCVNTQENWDYEVSRRK